MIEIVESIRPLAAVACPAVCVPLIWFFRKRPNIRELCTLSAGVLQFALILSLAPVVLRGNHLLTRLIHIAPGIEIAYKVDAFGLVFAITSSFLWIPVSLFSIGYMRRLEEHAQTRYYVMFALAIFSAVSLAMAANLITFYVFYEGLTFSTYWLVAHHEDEPAFSGAKKYMTYLLFSGWFLFAAVAMTYAFTGTTDFAAGGIAGFRGRPPATLVLLFILFALGSMKAAWMPFHSWLPGAMVAPTPVSSLLHAVAVVKAGVFGFVRIVAYVFGVDLFQALGLGIVLAAMASVTMILGSFFAIGEDNLKRRLAYSTVSQLSYILFGVALLSRAGVTGAMLHIPFHGFMKFTLFLCAGAVMVMTGKKKISQMAGIGRQMPVTMAAFAVGALGMSGVPPVAGFISKWFLCLGTLQAGLPVLMSVILVSSLLDVIYFFPIVRAAFFKKPDDENNTGAGHGFRSIEKDRPLNLFMVVPLAATAGFSILFFFFPNLFYLFDLVSMAVQQLFG